MAIFRYKMQSILDIKEKLETRAKQDFLEARMKLNEEEDKLRGLHQRRNEYMEQAKVLRTSVLKVQELRENQNALMRMDEYIRRQQMQVVTATKKMDKAQTALQEVMQERKAQEKLKEKAFAEFMMEESRRESKEIDELTTYRHGQKIASVENSQMDISEMDR